jgi:hypothetical protein
MELKLPSVQEETKAGKSKRIFFIKNGRDRCNVYEDVLVYRCSNCCGYNHKAADCKSNKVCSKCGSEDHISKDCRKIEECVNCSRANKNLNMRLNVDHNTFDRKCAIYKRYEEKYHNKIKYAEYQRQKNCPLDKQHKDLFGILVNAQGMLSNKDEIEMLMNKEKPVFLGLTETHVTEDFEDQEVEIKEYNVWRSDSDSRHTGGVLFYVREDILSRVVKKTAVGKNYWSIIVNIMVQDKNFYICLIYRSPNGKASLFFEYLDELGDWINVTGNNIIIMGDFNFNWADQHDNYCKNLKKWVNDIGLKQTVDDITRTTKTSGTIIDLVITNIGNIYSKVNVIPKISDHNNIYIYLDNLNASSVNKKINSIVKIDYDKLNVELNKCTWIDSKDSNKIWENISNNIKLCKNKSTTEIIRKKNMKINRWFNQEVKNAIKEKENSYKEFHLRKIAGNNHIDIYKSWDKYKKHRNKASNVLKKAKKNWFEQRIDTVKNDPKKMWITLKQLIAPKSRPVLNEVEIEGIIYSESHTIAEKVNEYYINSIKEIIFSIPISSQKNKRDEELKISKFTEFKMLSIEEIRKIVSNMKMTGSTDDIGLNIIKKTWEELGTHILHMINTSLQEGTVPDELKISTVVPIQKVRGSNKCADLRPINMLPIAEKILEEAVITQLKEFVKTENILVPEQSGFREKHSTETAIQLVLSNWMEATDDGETIIAAVFLDFKRAFETVDRELLLYKLERIGIGGIVLKWFRDYLVNRKQKVKHGNELSSEIPIVYGVPQGSKLGPLLFLLYINDIVAAVENCRVHLFADDTLIYCIAKKEEDIVNTLNLDLSSVESWLKNNKLKVNATKTKAMIIENRNVNLNNIKLYIDNTKIELVNSFKYLGVIIDHKLKFNDHAEYIIKKIAKKVGVLGRLRNSLSKMAKICIYNAIVRPHFNYCATVLHMIDQRYVYRLQLLQNRAIRIIYRGNRYSNIKRMMRELKWLDVRKGILMNVLIFMFKFDNELLPEYFNKYIIRNKDIHPYSTRNKNNLRDIRAKKNKTKRCILYNGIASYNRLPENLRQVNKLEDFIEQVKQYL